MEKEKNITSKTELPIAPQPANTPNNPPENKSLQKKMLIGGLFSFFVLLSVFVWFMNYSGNTANNNRVTKTPENIASIKTFEDCTDSSSEIINGSCTAPDGQVVIEENKPSDDKESTTTSANKSIKLLIGEDPGYMYDNVTTLLNSGDALKLQVRIVAENVEPNTCKLNIKSIADNPDNVQTERTLSPLSVQDVDFTDGWHTVLLECPGSNGQTLRVEKSLGVGDQKPERCANYSYISPSQSTATNVNELRTAINGSWQGCVQTPWWPSYFVSVTFNSDGTYNASSEEKIDGHISEGGFYVYNTKGPSASKIFEITTLQSGYLQVVRPESGVAQKGELKNIKLNGDLLTFDFYLTAKSSPLQFMLKR